MSARIIFKALAIAALGVAGYWSVRLAWADWRFRQNTPESVRKAVDLDPGNARYHAWLAEIEEYEGNDPAAELAIASKLDPSDSATWIRRGLRAESQGDFAHAEEFLLKAVAIDKLYAPRWALVNYYARRGDTERFWPWARQAIEMGYDDLSALFRLCWSVSSDAALIRARAIPPRTDVLGKYLEFLTRENRLDAAEPIARSFIAKTDGAGRQIALNYCDRLVAQKQVGVAVSIWNAMNARKLLPFSPLDPERGAVLTNGAFEIEPMQQGFDWRISSEPEVSVTRAESPAALRFRLSGKQPEHSELLAQFVPLAPDRSYTFRWEYRTSRGGGSGVRWNVAELARSPELGGMEWTSGQVTFASGHSSLASLELVYERAPGSVRSEGEIWLRNATISLTR